MRSGQSSSWTKFHAGVLQVSFLDPLLFLIYINKLSDNLTSNGKLFADDTPLSSAVHNVNTSAKKLNDDLKNVKGGTFQWKMISSSNPRKQAQNVIFSCKSKKPTHSTSTFNNNNDVSQSIFSKILGCHITFQLKIASIMCTLKLTNEQPSYTNFEIY